MTSSACTIAFESSKNFDGRDILIGRCSCGKLIWGWTVEGVEDQFDRHASIPVPPAEVLARRITVADVKAYPEYFISGPGRKVASATDCGHGYYLTDSCPCCP